MAKNVPLFKVGADPEFSFLGADGGDVVSAEDVITNVRSRFGLDGNAAIAELRPEPSTNPSEVVLNLSRDMTEGFYRNPGTQTVYWKAGSVPHIDDDNAMGGHIHFGIKRLADTKDYPYIVLHLDTYLTQVVRLLELPDEVEVRQACDYGMLGDHRVNRHGLEYRALGSWLTSPRVAEGVLSLAQVVVHNALKDPSPSLIPERHLPSCADVTLYDCEEENCTETKCVDYSAEYDRERRRDFLSYRRKFPQLRNRIRTFPLYEQRREAIEFLFKLVEGRKTWFPGKSVDIKAAWGITQASTPTDVPFKKALPSIRFNDIWKRAK